MNLNEYFLIGKIGKAKSFKGEVFLRIEDSEVFFALEDISEFHVNIKGKLIVYPIEKLSIKNDKTAIVKFKGINDTTLTEWIKNSEVYIPMDLLPESGEEEAFTHEYLNCLVVDEKAGEIGVINYIDKSSAQFLAYIEKDNREIIFPLIEEFIVSAELDKKILHTNLPEGIIDLNE